MLTVSYIPTKREFHYHLDGISKPVLVVPELFTSIAISQDIMHQRLCEAILSTLDYSFIPEWDERLNDYYCT